MSQINPKVVSTTLHTQFNYLTYVWPNSIFLIDISDLKIKVIKLKNRNVTLNLFNSQRCIHIIEVRTFVFLIHIKGTVCVISSDPAKKKGIAQFILVPLKPLTFCRVKRSV